MGSQTLSGQSYNKISKLINSSRFNEAFLLLKNKMKNFAELKKELDKLNDTERNYRYMLNYLAEGNNDPSQKEMIEQIKNFLTITNDMVAREERLIDSPDLYSSTRRLERLRNITLENRIHEFFSAFQEDNPDTNSESLKISSSQAQALSQLFNFVWTIGYLNADQQEALNLFFADNSTPLYAKESIISALILAGLEYMDPAALDILLNLYESSSDISIKAKSLAGLLLISLINPQNVSSNLNVRSQLMLIANDEDWNKNLNESLFSIIKTYDTKRIDNKMRNEVIPGLMKLNPEILDKMRNLASESENFLSDENPQWQELIEESEIGDKLREISDMQMEGADVLVTAFSNLKSFPFFNTLSNWFLPFIPGNYQFENLHIQNDRETISRLTTVMCDSDLHSFLLSLQSMPQEKRDIMLRNMEHQMKEAKEALESPIGETENQLLSKKLRHFLQDLYRFFKFYHKRNEFKDPFEVPFTADNIKPLISVMGIDLTTINVLAEFYFKNKYFHEASQLFRLIDEKDSQNYNLWEKIGYCEENLKNFPQAVEWYRKAELMNPDSPWLDKRLAISLKNSGYPKDAVEYYEKSLERQPDNYHLIMSAAQCYLDTGEIEKALQKFYHAQYLAPEKLDTERAIAWTELLAGNYEKSAAKYEKILSQSLALPSDFLNAAHCALASGDFKKALSLYKDFVEKDPQKDITQLVIALRDDAEIIKRLKIKTSDLRLIVDKIRYDILN